MNNIGTKKRQEIHMKIPTRNTIEKMKLLNCLLAILKLKMKSKRKSRISQGDHYFILTMQPFL